MTCLTVLVGVVNFVDDVQEYFCQNCHAMMRVALIVHVMLINDLVADYIHDLVLRFFLPALNHPYLTLKEGILENRIER